MSVVIFATTCDFEVPSHRLAFLCFCKESHFVRVTPDVYDQLHKMVFGFNNSKIVEDVFKLLRDRERHHPSGMMSPLERWHKARTSRLILENDCKEVQVTEAARSAAATKVPSSTHIAGEESFSMGSNTLATLGGKADWPTLSPMAWRRVPCAWKCYRELGGDWQMVQMAWLSQLAQPGMLLHRTDSAEAEKTASLILGATEYGTLVWDMDVRKFKNLNIASFPREAARQCSWRLVPICRLDCWSVVALEPKPPSEPTYAGQLRVVLVVEGPSMSLVQASAKKGFRGLSVHFLAKLLKVLNMIFAKGCIPRTPISRFAL